MKKKEFLDVVRKYFRSIGFQSIKGNKFLIDSNEVVLMVYLNHSNFSNMYYVDYYIRIKRLHPKITEITSEEIWDTHFSRITDGKDNPLIFDYENMVKTDCINVLKRRIDEQLFPILDKGIYLLKQIITNSIKYPQYYIAFTDQAQQELTAL